jgi:hypothetical protein
MTSKLTTKQTVLNKTLKTIVISVVGICVVIVILFAYHAYIYKNLESTAKSLPSFNDITLANGDNGERECYVSRDKDVCRAINLRLEDEQNTTAKVTEFIQNSKKQGIQWLEPRGQYESYSSEIFERDNSKYQILIDRSASDLIWISLVEQ